MTTKAKQILETSQNLAVTAETWADLSNLLFDPVDGLVAKAYPTREERERFVKTREYRAIQELIDSAVQRTGLVDGATPKKSGRFVVRLPHTLHAALEAEARDEGVSLNQLVLTKLAVQMSRLSAGSVPDMARIAQAYLEVRDGYSIDRVVADPELDRKLLRRCRDLGLAGTDFELNWRLFNGRKNKWLTDLPKTKNYTPSRKDEFEFSSEIAIRYVQEQIEARERRHVSLDKIICDPDLAAEFDTIAARLAPGFSPLDYRWVALGVRKAAGRYASKAKEARVLSFTDFVSTLSVKASSIPTDQGVYLFRCEDESLFVGETDNLRQRIERHFDTSECQGLPDWLYDRGSRGISLSFVPTPEVSSTERKIIELGTVHRLTPCFNYLGGQVA
jgi:site-specific DNA-methyltransferase (adenine-specific)